MVSLLILTQLFQSVILPMSAMDLDFIDPEVEAQMDERQMEEEQENAIHGARGGCPATMKLSLGWRGFDNFSSSENVFYPYCLNSFEPQKIFHFPRISLFVCFMLSVFFDLNQHHLKDPWLEKT